MGRTPSSVALKLGNIKAWDPMRSGKGLAHGSKLDAHVWEEYDAKGNERMRIRVSSTVPLDGSYNDWLWSFDKREMRLPTRMRPRRDFIEYHNDVIFKG